MATTIFPFTFLRRGFREYFAFATAIHEQGGGRRTTQKLKAAPELVVRGEIMFPNPGGSYGDFEALWLAAFGGWGSMLYKRQDRLLKGTSEVQVAVAAQVNFDAARRFVDVSTLVVKKAGVVQTLATHYTLQNESGGAYVLGTSTKLVVHFLAAPGAGVQVALEYEPYYPVRFDGDELPDEQDLIAGGAGGADVADRTIAVRLRETGPGFSYAAVPNAL